MGVIEVRNGSFERGNLDFWTVFSGTLEEIQTTIKRRGSYALKVTSTGAGQIKARHNDYHKVSSRALLRLGVAGYPDVNATLVIKVQCFDSSYNSIGWIYDSYSITGTQWTYKEWIKKVLPETVYIQAEVWITGATGLTIQYLDTIYLEVLEIDKYGTDEEELINIINETTEHTAYGEEFFTGLWREAEYSLKCTSLTGGTPLLDVAIQAYDPTIGDWTDILTFIQLGVGGGSERKVLTSGLGWIERVKYVTADVGVLTDCDFKVGVIYKR